jgi:cyanophycinase-like exopeptidase
MKARSQIGRATWVNQVVRLMLVGCATACSSRAAQLPTQTDASNGSGRDAGNEVIAPTDAATGDAAMQDARATTSNALTLHARLGSPRDDGQRPTGPALVLDGGFTGASVLRWVRSACSSSSGAHCDVVVLSAAPADFSTPWLTAAAFHSAQTIVLEPGATPNDYEAAAAIVAQAEVVYFLGGDQARYVRWSGTAVMRAVQAVHDRGGVVGGTSAGMIILGSSVNDALNTLSENITTPICVANPDDPKLHFTQNLLRLTPLQRTIADPHFRGRDRMGRLATFMARQVRDGFAVPDILGVGVDDGAALVIDAQGIGHLLADAPGPAAFIVRGGLPARAEAAAPLLYQSLTVTKLASSADSFDFVHRCGNAPANTLSIDGSQSPPYLDAYAGGVTTNTCQ